MKPTTTNKHWIGPKRGAQVSVVLRDAVAPVRRVFQGVVVAPYRAVVEGIIDGDDGNAYSIELFPYLEGSMWCHDWEGENVDALRAAAALS